MLTPPPHRVLAIGDIHGCATALSALLDAVRLAAGDELVILGDAVDRGPDSRGVINQLLDLSERLPVQFVLGNHEQMLLDSIDGRMPRQEWLGFGGAETLDSYKDGAGEDAIPARHVEFIRSWGDYHETSSHFFAHGNYVAKLPLDQQRWQHLRWISLKQQTPAVHCSGKTAVLGHTSNKKGEIVNLGHLICIDTYCHGGGWLTALDTVTGGVWQANNQGESRQIELPPIRAKKVLGWWG